MGANRRGKQCMWIAKSTYSLVGQQPKPIDRTVTVRLSLRGV